MTRIDFGGIPVISVGGYGIAFTMYLEVKDIGKLLGVAVDMLNENTGEVSEHLDGDYLKEIDLDLKIRIMKAAIKAAA